MVCRAWGSSSFWAASRSFVAPDDNSDPVRPRAPEHAAGGLAKQGSAPGQILQIAPLDRPELAASGKPTVIIDPGHGGVDEGTKYFGLAEKDVTLDVAQRLERVLKSVRVETVLTRRDDVYVSLPDRAEIANLAAGSNSNVIFVSIHFNQSAVESVDGIETYYADKKIPPPTERLDMDRVL